MPHFNSGFDSIDFETYQQVAEDLDIKITGDERPGESIGKILKAMSEQIQANQREIENLWHWTKED